MTGLWYNSTPKAGMRRGQAALEYVIALCSVVVITGLLWWVVHAAEGHVRRSEALMTSDCP